MSLKSQVAAANRFGLGAMPGELERIGREPRGWLQSQLKNEPDLTAFVDLPDGLELLQRRAAVLAARRSTRKNAAGNDAEAAMPSDRRARYRQRLLTERDGQPNDRANDMDMAPGRGLSGKPAVSPMEIARDGFADIAARYRVATTTATPFVERLVRFWSNHFAVSADKNVARLQAAPMEREAIRPNMLGNFADLLLAVERHPAMLLYLDNTVSIGDDSRMAQFAERRATKRGSGDQPTKPARKLGLNENLAREILELHTLGVDGGYAQNDVQELARAITGWGTPGLRDLHSATSAFVFRANAHEPGARSVLGKRYADAGESQGRAILRDLAMHPATAKHLSYKLARHFVADAPPPALVQRMTSAYLRSGGELRALYRAMIDDDAAWSDDARKFKTPDDFVVSALRAGGAAQIETRTLTRLLEGLGQPVFTPRSPAGFPDSTSDWATGDALRKRVQAAAQLAERVRQSQTPYALAAAVLGHDAAESDLGALLRRAGSPQEGFALLFSSPAFQWRV